MILLSKTATGVVVERDCDAENGQGNTSIVWCAKRLSQTFRAKSTRICAEDPKMLWADSVSTAYLIYRIPYVLIVLYILEEEWRGKDTSLTHLKVFGCDSFVKVKDVCGKAMKCTFIGSGSNKMSATDSSSLIKPIQKIQVVLVDIPEKLTENDSIVTEHELSSEITQTPGGSSNTSEGSENSGSFEDSGRLDEEYFEDRILQRGKLRDYTGMKIHQRVQGSSKERRHHKACGCSGLKKIRMAGKASWTERKPRVQMKEIMYGLNQAPRLWYLKFDNFMQKDKALTWQSSTATEFNKPKWQLSLVFEMKDICSEKHVLCYVLTVGVTTVEWESRLQKSIT
ncbi:hypothetical protein Tco_1487360, partial [Tanacetum coccineum]